MLLPCDQAFMEGQVQEVSHRWMMVKAVIVGGEVGDDGDARDDEE